MNIFTRSDYAPKMFLLSPPLKNGSRGLAQSAFKRIFPLCKPLALIAMISS